MSDCLIRTETGGTRLVNPLPRCVFDLIPFVPALLFLLAGCQPDDARLVYCQHPDWNFGSVSPESSSILRHNFVLHNRSNNSVLIRNIHADCSCVIPPEKPGLIPANSDVQIPVEYIVSPDPGLVTRKVSVTFEGQHLPVLLSLHGEVMPSACLYATPKHLDFGEFLHKEKKIRTLTLRRFDGTEIRVKKIIPPTEEYLVEVRDSIYLGGLDIQLTMSATEIPEDFRKDTITIITDRALDGSQDSVGSICVPVFARRLKHLTSESYQGRITSFGSERR